MIKSKLHIVYVHFLNLDPKTGYLGLPLEETDDIMFHFTKNYFFTYVKSFENGKYHHCR